MKNSIAFNNSGSNEKKVPSLHVELVSAPNIINNGKTENELMIGVFNPSLSGQQDLVFEEGKPIYFLFVADDTTDELSPSRPWGIAHIDDLSQAQLSLDNAYASQFGIDGEVTNHFSKRPDLYGWIIRPLNEVTLTPGEYMVFTISGLKSNLPDGYTTPWLYYDDDEYHIFTKFGPILKSPVISMKQRVGVGTDSPDATLQITEADSVSMVIETTSNSSAWSKYALKTKHAQWSMSTSNQWYDNMLYFKEETKENSENILFYLTPEGNAGIGQLPQAVGNPPQANPKILDEDYRLSIQEGKNGTLHVARNSELVKDTKDVPNLIKFGADGDFQFSYHASGHFSHPTLALHAADQHTVGVYGPGNTPLLEVDANSGDTFIKGKISIGDGSQDTLAELNGKSKWQLQAQEGGITIQNSRNNSSFCLIKNGGVEIKNDGASLLKIDESGYVKLAGGLSPFMVKRYSGKYLKDSNVQLINSKVTVSGHEAIIGGFGLGSWNPADSSSLSLCINAYTYKELENLDDNKENESLKKAFNNTKSSFSNDEWILVLQFDSEIKTTNFNLTALFINKLLIEKS